VYGIELRRHILPRPTSASGRPDYSVIYRHTDWRDFTTGTKKKYIRLLLQQRTDIIIIIMVIITSLQCSYGRVTLWANC